MAAIVSTGSGRAGPRRDGGFTLIELLIVIAILGILSVVVVFAVGGINDRGEESACEADRNTVEVAVEAYFAQNGSYPANEAALVPAFMRRESTLYNVGAGGAVTPVAGTECATAST